MTPEGGYPPQNIEVSSRKHENLGFRTPDLGGVPPISSGLSEKSVLRGVRRANLVKKWVLDPPNDPPGHPPLPPLFWGG